MSKSEVPAQTAPVGALCQNDLAARIHRTLGRFLSAIERNRLVNSWGVVNQRFGEFSARILGFGRNHRGSFRDLMGISRNGERGREGGGRKAEGGRRMAKKT
jgi:hypothetical protein